jgi:hypothetical protein
MAAHDCPSLVSYESVDSACVQPTREQLEYRLKFKRTDAVVTTVIQAIKWGCLLGITRYGYHAIVSLAGKQTIADIVVRFLASVKIREGIAYLLAAGGVLFGVGERQLRRRTIKRTVKSKNDLEKIVHL